MISSDHQVSKERAGVAARSERIQTATDELTRLSLKSATGLYPPALSGFR
jgi:hypothetical protein